MTGSPRVTVAPPFSPDDAALNFAVKLLRLDHADYELRHSHLSATDGDIPAIREALRRLADRLDAETREWSVRYADGFVDGDRFTEAGARRRAAEMGEHLEVVCRTVGPWIAASEVPS